MTRGDSIAEQEIPQRLMRHGEIKATPEFDANLDDVLDKAIRKA